MCADQSLLTDLRTHLLLFHELYFNQKKISDADSAHQATFYTCQGAHRFLQGEQWLYLRPEAVLVAFSGSVLCKPSPSMLLVFNGSNGS